MKRVQIPDCNSASALSKQLLAASVPASGTHPYLLRKKIASVETLREIAVGELQRIIGYTPNVELKKLKTKAPLVGQILLSPIKIDDALSSIAMIDEQGLKSSLAGGIVKGGAWFSSSLPNAKYGGREMTIAVGEGIATVLSVTQTMNWFGAAALSCWNLKAVAESLRSRYPHARIVILGDVGNGEADAYNAASSSEAVLAIPNLSGLQGTDWNDLLVGAGAAEVKAQLEETLGQNRPLYLSPLDPFGGAKQIVRERFMSEGCRTLHFYRGNWREWTGTYYGQQDEDWARSELYSILSEAVTHDKEKKTVQPFLPTKPKVNNMYDALHAAVLVDSDVEMPTWLNSDGIDRPNPAEIVALRNGLLHLPSQKLHPHSPMFFNGNALEFDYDKNAQQPKIWLEFLQSVWPKSKDCIQTLQEIFGLLLTPDTSQQKVFLIIGPKRSGKGTIAKILTALLGSNNVCNPTPDSLGRNFGLAPLIGKQLAIMGDARFGGRIDQSVIAERLLSISGEDDQTIDRKYKSEWTGPLKTRFMILTNEMPRINDASGALASRFIVLTMTESFYGREDHKLFERLSEELPGIFNWAIQGWLRLRRRGHLTQPKTSREAIEELEALSSPINAFIKECCTVKAGIRIGCTSLYQAWCDWCRQQGREHTGTLQSFGRDLHAAAPSIRVVHPPAKAGQTRTRAYEGIGTLTTSHRGLTKY